MSSERDNSADGERPAFYALTPGGWRDYWTLLHPPYTIWHLSYVVMGASLAPVVNVRWLVETLIAFFLAMGIAAHALDELHGRPLSTRIPDAVLWALAAIGLGRRGRARHRWRARGLTVDLGVHRRRRLPGARLQPRAVRRLGALRSVVRSGVGRLPRPHGVLRADGAHRTGGDRAGRGVCGHLCGAAGPVDTCQTAPTPGRGGRGNDHVARRRRRADRRRDAPIRSGASAPMDVARDAVARARDVAAEAARTSPRRSSSSRPLRSI